MDWLKIDKNVKAFEDNLLIPDEKLSGIEYLQIKLEEDLLKIPKSGGCYWIWTNETIKHSFHVGNFPVPFDEGEIIYNGIAKDNVRERIKKHLFSHKDEGMSAISIDLIFDNYQGSHRKKALDSKGKTAYLNTKRIKDRNELLNLNWSPSEREFIAQTSHPVHFRNGINILEPKHNTYIFKVYFICGFKSASYGDIIEKRWRENHGLPRLCTYKKGR